MPASFTKSSLKKRPAIRPAHSIVSRALTEREWRNVVDQFLRAPNYHSLLELDCYGGAINGKPRAENAFNHRSSAFCAFVQAFWEEGDAGGAHRFLADWCSVFEAFWNGEIYQNFPSAAYIHYRWNYWGEAFPALLAIKRKYDPQNLFQFPQAISAEGGTSALWPPNVALPLAETISKRPIRRDY